MKINKQTLKRLVSILVVIAVMATNCVSLPAAMASAEVADAVVTDTAVEYGSPVVEPAKLLPYYLGDNDTAFPGSSIDVRGSIGGQSGTIKGDVLASVAPQISAKGEGYNGTYAMKYGTDQGGFYRYLTKYRLEGAMSKLVAEPVTIEMKVKLVSGNVKALYAGNYRSAGPAELDTDNDGELDFFTTETNYSTVDLSTTEWTTLKFTRTETAGTSRWMFINLVASGDQGAVILIDDIKVYLESDTFKTNLFTSDNIWLNKVTSDYQSGNYDAGSFDINRGLSFDNTPLIDTMYDPDSVGARLSTVAPVISAAGEGVKNSYAMQLGVDATSLKNDVMFQASGRQTITYDTTYTIEMKIKVKSGSLEYFKAGIYENSLGSKSNYSFYLLGSELTDNWQYYKFNVTTGSDTADWKRTALYFVANSADTVVLIDDLQVYKADDESKTLIEYQNNAVGGVMASDGSFDTPVSTAQKQAPVSQIGYYLGAGTTDPGDSFDARDGSGSHYSAAVKAEIMPRLSEEGEGYNSPYAMKVGHTAPLSRYRFSFRFSDAKRGAFVTGTAYTIEMQVKKVSGTLDSLAAVQHLYSSNTYVGNTVYTNTDISTEEYTKLTFTHTACTEDGTSNTGVRYLYFDIKTAAEDGVVLLIDNIYIYAADDTAKTNIFTGEKLQISTTAGFESYTGGAVNVGEFECSGLYNITDTTPEAGVIYSYPYRIAQNTLGEVGNRISGSNSTVITSGNAPKFTELGEGVKGSYAMEIGGTDAIAEGEYDVTFGARYVPSSTKLRIEADVKLVSGSVTSLKMGILEDQTTEKARNSIMPSLLSNRWTTFTWTQTTYASMYDTWAIFKISLVAPEGGAILHIDNIRIYADGDETKTPVFKRFADFDLDFDIASFTPIKKDSADSLYTQSFNHSGETLGDGKITVDEEEVTVETTGTAQLVCMENAHSGDYALAIGYDDEQALTNYGIRFGLRELLPGKRYRVSFATAVSGGTFYKMTASLTSAIGNADDAEYLVYGHRDDLNVGLEQIPYEWTEVTFDFYEGGTLYDRGSWAYLKFDFEDYNLNIGDSAMFIDSVSVCEIDEEGNVIGPNIFADGDFEYISNTFDWENYESPFWSEGGADDFTFMNDIDKEIGAYNATVEAGVDLFENMLTKEPYCNFDTYMINAVKRDVMTYEATKLKEADKKVWLALTDIIRVSDGQGNRWLVDNWQDLIMASANELQLICGDNFQGFYFDEPGYYLTNDEYITVTKWLRETFKKRVWSVHYKDTVNGLPYTVTENDNDGDGVTDEWAISGSKLTITKESHQYTTDVGYWRYGTWDEDATKTLDVFKGMCTGDEPIINLDTRKWMVPVLGRHAYYYQTAQEVLEITQNMYDGFGELSNFGGVAFYCMSYDNATVTVEVDENGGDKVLTAYNNGVLKCVDIDNVVNNEDGTRTYTYLVNGGYYMLDPTDENYVESYDAVCDEVDAIISDFATHNALTVGDNIELDGNLIVHNAGNTVADLLDSLGLDETAKVLADGATLSSDAIVKNGQTLSIPDLRGETLTYTIVKRYDLNSDGLVNAVDVVKGKKAVAGSVTATELEHLAATASRNALTVTDIAALRNSFMN